MTARFIFRGHNYLSPSFKEAEKFLAFWGEKKKVHEFKTTWIITHVERGPGWAPTSVMENSRCVIEWSDGTTTPEL